MTCVADAEGQGRKMLAFMRADTSSPSLVNMAYMFVLLQHRGQVSLTVTQVVERVVFHDFT